eukprot:CAMPEP_0206210078 /NCGR_PEP_ID=MMETSP0166-20121206/17308_1 /ASSEMBLY_ACC=CAM_ASM_000260 /TAXON_ID=95228 /ORGANISM="Vannella robusta, Strain DIVA3 518/3/11/1/6" /LENGTH=660 /DNA_ID=CAMNT_0053631633 /DNA_START=718 /DNA_END=2697 /DNA_ORIENTATION=+
MKEITQSDNIQELSLYEKETLVQLAGKAVDNSKKKKKKSSSVIRHPKKFKGSKTKEVVPVQEPVVENEPESENTRAELTRSRELATVSQPQIPAQSPKKTKLPRLKRKQSKQTEVVPVLDATEPAQESRKTPVTNEPKVSESKPIEPKKKRKKTAKSLPEESLVAVKKKSKSSKRTKKSSHKKCEPVHSDNVKRKRSTRKRKSKKKKRSPTDIEASSDDDSYYSDQFLFELDEGSDYTCLTEADIIAEQSREIQEVSEILSVSESAAITLLKHFKWNRDKLMTSYFDNPDKVLEDAGVGEESLVVSVPNNHDPQEQQVVKNEPSDAEIECTICSMDVLSNEMYSLQSCGHSFCEDCWRMYLTIQIKEGQAFVNCAHMDCTALVPEVDVKRLVDGEVYQKYCTFFMQSFVDNNDNVKWCPAPGCGNAVNSSMINGNTVTCACSYRFCFRCSEEAHEPASCKQVKMWQKKCQDESETNNWIVANTQECPKCGLPTEKNGGCNHMTCRQCKHEYCWVCNKDWKGHNDFYSCNRYKSKDDKKSSKKNSRKEREQQRLEMRRALEKYLHYHSRFVNHSRSSELEASSEKAHKKMHLMKETEATDSEVLFIEQAINQLIAARSVLKYSYVLRYYMVDEDPKAGLLEYLQEDLEKTAEALSEILSNP